MKLMIVSLLVLPVLLNAGVEGVVTASPILNVRVKNDVRYSVVAKVKKGKKLKIVKYENEWYQIIAPSDSAVWVSSLFVENGTVTKRVHLRSGPSLAFSSYRLAAPGEKVKVIDSSKKGWLKISPPEGLTAWVSAKYVFLTPGNAAELAGKPKDPKQNNKDKKVVKDKKNIDDAFSDAPLPFIDGKGETVTVDGYLVALRKGSEYVTHAIATKVNGEYFPLCYVHSDTHNLKLWEKRRVSITGVQRWVKGWKRPVVNLTKINSAR